MKVDIRHVEKTVGWVFKRKHYGVAVRVIFDTKERAIIQERRLERDVVLERGYPSDVSDAQAEKYANRSLGRQLLNAAVNGADANNFHLTIGKLMKGEDVYHHATPIEAKQYEETLKEGLVGLKGYILGNAEIEEKEASFEI